MLKVVTNFRRRLAGSRFGPYGELSKVLNMLDIIRQRWGTDSRDTSKSDLEKAMQKMDWALNDLKEDGESIHEAWLLVKNGRSLLDTFEKNGNVKTYDNSKEMFKEAFWLLDSVMKDSR